MDSNDLVPTKSNIDLFNKTDIEDLLWKELYSMRKSVDLRILNLEVTLV